jgi:DNA repair protein RadC
VIAENFVIPDDISKNTIRYKIENIDTGEMADVSVDELSRIIEKGDTDEQTGMQGETQGTGDETPGDVKNSDRGVNDEAPQRSVEDKATQGGLKNKQAQLFGEDEGGFSLFGEKSVDGDRVIREREAKENAKKALEDGNGTLDFEGGAPKEKPKIVFNAPTASGNILMEEGNPYDHRKISEDLAREHGLEGEDATRKAGQFSEQLDFISNLSGKSNDGVTPSKKKDSRTVSAAPRITDTSVLVNRAAIRDALKTRDPEKLRSLFERGVPVATIITELARSKSDIHWDVRGFQIENGADAAALFIGLRSPLFEQFSVLYLDSRNAVIEGRVISVGVLDASLVNPSDVFGNMPAGAVSVILGHNHPSEKTDPSDSDKRLTRQLVEAGRVAGVPVTDHIITQGHFTSLRENGVVDFNVGVNPERLSRVIPRKEMKGRASIVHPFKNLEGEPDWNVMPRSELPDIHTPEELADVAMFFRAASPDYFHVVGLNTRNKLQAVWRFPNGTSGTEVMKVVSRQVGKFAVKAILMDYPGAAKSEINPGVPSSEMMRMFRGVQMHAKLIGVDLLDILAVDAKGKPLSMNDSGMMQFNEARPEWNGKIGLVKESRGSFYSPLERGVTAMKLNQAIPGDQMLSKIKGLPGVKLQEIEESGLSDYLKTQPKVTKELVSEFLKHNGVKVEEVVKGDDGDLITAADATSVTQSRNQSGAIIYTVQFKGGRSFRVSSAEADDEYNASIIAANAYNREKVPSATKYAQYEPPGGKNYREVLLKLPNSGATKDGIKVREDGFGGFAADDPQGRVIAYGATAEEARLAAWRKVGDISSSDFISSHWSEPNVLAHMLMDDRTIPLDVLAKTHPALAAKLNAEGKTEARALHMIEGQSDWHQAGVSKGYADPMPWVVYSQDSNEVLSRHATKDEADAALKMNSAPRLDTRMQSRGDTVPSAPFKSDAWKRLVIRTMLKHAVDGGYDLLTWSTGADRAAKWGSERVEWKKQDAYKVENKSNEADYPQWVVVDNQGREVLNPTEYWPRREEAETVMRNIRQAPTFTVAGTEQSGGEHAGMNLEQAARERGMLLEKSGKTVRTKDDLREIVHGILRSPEAGKVDKLTDRIWDRMQTEPEGTSMPRKEFFEFLYDKSFVNEANDIARKMDKVARVGKSDINATKAPPAIYDMYDKNNQQYLARYFTKEEMTQAVTSEPDRWTVTKRFDDTGTTVNAIPITDALRASIKEGQPLYNRDTGMGMPPAAVEAAISPIRSQFPGLTFTVKESGDVAGQQQGRSATLFANRITDADHAKRVALEEAAHAGIRSMTPAQWRGLMNSTFQLRRAEYRRMIDMVKEQYPEYAAGSPEFMEEVVAHIAQAGRTNQSMWSRFVAALRSFFRKQGWVKSLTDNDVDSLINSTFNQVEKKAPSFSTSDTNGSETRGAAEAMAQDLGVTMTGLPRTSDKIALDRIRLATGWIKSANGRWMYEATDSRMNVNPDGKTLGTAVNHPTLFNLYPEISNVPADLSDPAGLTQAIRTAIQNTEPAAFSKTSDDYTGEFKKFVKSIEAATPIIEAGVKAGEIKAKRDMTVRGRALIAEDRKKAELQPLKNEPVTIPGVISAAVKTGQEIEREKGRKMSIEYSVDKSFRAQAKDQGVKEMDWLEKSATRLKYLKDTLTRTPDADRSRVIMEAMRDILGADRSRAALRAAHFKSGDVLEYVTSELHDRMINRYAKGISKVFDKIIGDGVVPNPNMDKLTDDAKEMAKQWLSEIPSRENGMGFRTATLSGIDYERLQDWWNRWLEIKALDRNDRETIIKDERWSASKLSEALVEEAENAHKSQIDGAVRPKNAGNVADVMVDFFANTSLMAQRAFGGLKSMGHALFSDGLTKAENEYKAQKHKARLALGKELERLGVTFFKKTDMMTTIRDIKAGGLNIKMTDAERMHLAAFVGLMENDKMTGGRVIARHHILRDGFIRESLAGTNSKVVLENMPAVVADIVKTLTPTEKAIVRKIVEIQTGMGAAGNKVSKRLTGRSLFTEDWYMGMRPERVSEITADELNTNAGAQKFLENSGFTKTVVDHKMPIKIGNIFAAFDEHVDGMSRYIGMTIPLRSIRTAMKANDSALTRSLNERMGTAWTRRMTQTMLKLAGSQNPQHGPIKLLSSLSSNVMRSILAWNPGSYFNNRVPGAIMLAAAISEKHPKAAATILAKLAVPTPIKTNGVRAMTPWTKENERIRAYLMEHGFLGDRWDSDYSSIAAPITKDAASQLKGKVQMVLRHVSNLSLNPMMHAEVRNGIDAFKALKADGLSDEAARDIVAAATRATQNSSSPLDDSAFIQGVRDFGLGGLFPFISQSVVARNFLVSRMADKNFKGMGIAVSGLGASIGATVMFHSLLKSMRNGPGGDDDDAKEVALIDSLGNIFDAILPGSGIITEQFLNTMFGKYQNGGALIIEKPLSELAKLAGNIAADKDDISYSKAVRAFTQILGLPTGGIYSAFGIAKGLLDD